jgi:hypothetical protein
VPPAAAEVGALLERLVAEDAVGQLVERRGRMAELGSEAGRVRLDWVTALDHWVGDPHAAERLEGVVAAVLGGADRLLWCGMGGSVMAVRSMLALGMPGPSPVNVVALDTTDPGGLDLALDALGGPFAAVGVSMGLTSEEPLSHLRWLADPATGCARRTVMTVPGSMLEGHAAAAGLRRVPLQPDGADGTPGRMSAPGTHVFLLPALLACGGGAALQASLAQAQARHGVTAGSTVEERRRLTATHPAVALACRLHLHLRAGRDKALVRAGPGAEALAPWVEQLVEESLGKGGRGLLVFPGQSPALLDDPPADCFALDLDAAVRPGWTPGSPTALAELFAGWTLAVAVLGWLEGITFAGQPAVEGYKRHARELRDAPGVLALPVTPPPAVVAERTLGRLAASPRGYLDVTLNAAAATRGWPALATAALRAANGRLRRPAKLRVAPAHYHSTEQAQVDGPPAVHSIRIGLRRTGAVRAGAYDARYLHAQTLGAARAMGDAGRPVELLVVDGAEGLDALAAALS